MNIHLRVIGRLLKAAIFPFAVGFGTVAMFEYLSLQQIGLVLAFGVLIFMLVMVYRWILSDIRIQDQLAELRARNKVDNKA
jgi:hypothetical protein